MHLHSTSIGTRFRDVNCHAEIENLVSSGCFLQASSQCEKMWPLLIGWLALIVLLVGTVGWSDNQLEDYALK